MPRSPVCPSSLLVPSAIKGIAYDFDGTLVDSFDPIHGSFNHMLRHFGYDSPLTYQQMLSLVGGPLEESVARILPPAFVREGTAVFRSHYARIYLDRTVPMPGAHAILRKVALSGIPQSVVTNKLGHSARELIGHFGWSEFLTVCLGEGDGFRLKPSPEMIGAAAEKMGLPLSGLLFVGDSPYDYEAAKGAGVPICLLTTGTHGREELSALSPDLLFESLDSLNAWLAVRAPDRDR